MYIYYKATSVISIPLNPQIYVITPPVQKNIHFIFKVNFASHAISEGILKARQLFYPL